VEDISSFKGIIENTLKSGMFKDKWNGKHLLKVNPCLPLITDSI
jgi:hypothetical protein